MPTTITIHDILNFGLRADPPSQEVASGASPDEVVFHVPGPFVKATLFFPKASTVFEDKSPGQVQPNVQDFPTATNPISGEEKGKIKLKVKSGLTSRDRFQYAIYREIGSGNDEREFAQGNSPPDVIIQ